MRSYSLNGAMTKIPASGSNKNQANQAIGIIPAGTAKEAALLQEFSELLDKIASHIGATSEAQSNVVNSIVDLSAMTPASHLIEAAPKHIASVESSRPPVPKKDPQLGDTAEKTQEKGANSCAPDAAPAQSTKSTPSAETQQKSEADAAPQKDIQPQILTKEETQQIAAQLAAQQPGTIAQPRELSRQAQEDVPADLSGQGQTGEQQDSSQPQTEVAVQSAPVAASAMKGEPKTRQQDGPVKGVEPTATQPETSTDAQGAEVQGGEQDLLRQALMTQLQARLKDSAQQQSEAVSAAGAKERTRVDEKVIAQALATFARDAGQASARVQAPLEDMLLHVQNIKRSVNAVQPSVAGQGMVSRKGESVPHFEEVRTRPLTQRLGTQTMERVEQALKEVAKAKDGKTISVRLDPGELGSVKVDISLREGALHARLVADSPQVTQLLREKAADLQLTLRKLGLHVDSVTVAVVSDEARSDSGASSNTFGGNSNPSRQETEQRVPTATAGVLGAALSASKDTGIVLDHWVA